DPGFAPRRARTGRPQRSPSAMQRSPVTHLYQGPSRAIDPAATGPWQGGRRGNGGGLEVKIRGVRALLQQNMGYSYGEAVEWAPRSWPDSRVITRLRGDAEESPGSTGHGAR